jgi:hypothetical protein
MLVFGAILMAGAECRAQSSPKTEKKARRTPGLKDDVPLQPLWRTQMPDPRQEAAGFPKLATVRTAVVYRPQSQQEAYSHCSELIWHAGRFYVMWINHPEGEDLPGQRILYSSSADGIQWTAASELFPPPGEIKLREAGKGRRPSGSLTKTYTWCVVDGRLYGVAGVYDNWRKDCVPAAREVRPDGTFGPCFAVEGKVKVPTTYPILPADQAPVAGVPSQIAAFLADPLHLPPMYHNYYLGLGKAVDGNELWEPATYRGADGNIVRLFRGKFITHHMYVSVSTDDGKTFGPIEPTDIPDSPSLARAARLDDGTILLVGNQVADKFDRSGKGTHYARDPLTISISRDGHHFDQVYAMRWGSPKLRFKGTGGVGFQYPSAILHEGRLCVAYTVGKEDVEMASVDLAELRPK